MRVPSDVLRGVCFVAGRRYDGEAYLLGGTGFFVAWTRGDGWPQAYLVTARHCVEGAAAHGDGSVHVYLNTKGGGTRYAQVTGEWLFPADPSVDLAAVPFEPTDDDDVAMIDSRQLLTMARTQKHSIGVGDDVWIAGLFRISPGIRRMRPVVRVGTIAAMPEEPFEDTVTLSGEVMAPYEAYLIEVRSIGGLSGSPVWVHLPYGRGYGANSPPPPPSRRETQRREIAGVIGGGDYTENLPHFLLGIIRQHWNAVSGGRAGLEHLNDFADHRLVNMGMAAVTPIQALIDLMLREDVAEARRARARDYMRERAGRSGDEDSPTDAG